jgi:hypothetical protein
MQNSLTYVVTRRMLVKEYPDSYCIVDESHLELFNGYSIDADTIVVFDDLFLLPISQNSLPYTLVN